MKSDNTLVKTIILGLMAVLLGMGCGPISFASPTATSTPVFGATGQQAPGVGSAAAVSPTNTPLPTSTVASVTTAAPAATVTTASSMTSSAATATSSSVSGQADAAVFATYFTSITLGRVPRGSRPVNTSPTSPTPTTAFSSGDFICVTYSVIKTVQPGLGLYDVDGQKWALSKTILPQFLQPGSSTRCEPFIPAVGRYEAMVWVGDTLVYIQPFEVH